MPELVLSDLFLALLMCLAAALYTSVGHAGASAYLALMALFGMAPATMRPTALVLNILVAILVSARFYLAGHFNWRRTWPFIVGALPMAFLGGYIQPPTTLYRPLVGLVLLFAAARLLWPGGPRLPAGGDRLPPPIPAMTAGAAIGFLSGLTGTGGGIFLSPLLLMAGWATPKAASATAAVFILANSSAGLAGNLASVRALPDQLPLFVIAVIIGSLIGSRLGSMSLSNDRILKALGVVLVIAGSKLLLS